MEWKVGDVCLRKNEICATVKISYEDDPPYAVVRTAAGREVGVELSSLRKLDQTDANVQQQPDSSSKNGEITRQDVQQQSSSSDENNSASGKNSSSNENNCSSNENNSK